MQNYSAIDNNLGLTAIVAFVPVLYLFWALAIQRMKGWVAGSTGLLVTIIVSVLLYHMPVSAAISAAALGAVNGLFPIGWIILTAVFLYNLLVESGQFEIFQRSITSISGDRRIQTLLIAFCFTAFMEGVAGQGAPVAVSAAILIGMGFPPLLAAALCLIGDTVCVPYGPVGVPTIMMATVTNLNHLIVSGATGIEMTILTPVIVIFVLVVVAGWRNAMEVLPAAIVTIISYAVPTFLISRYVGPELVAILSSLVSLLCLFLFMRVWQPKTIWRFANDVANPNGERIVGAKAVGAQAVANTPDITLRHTIEKGAEYTSGQILKAWVPFIILTVVMLIWGLPLFKTWIVSDLKWYLNVPSWPFLNGIVYQVAPVVKIPTAYAAHYQWQFITTPGTAMLVTSLISMAVLRISPMQGLRVFGKTFMQLRSSFVMLTSVIGIGYLANYSGISYTLGLTCAFYTSILFPIFSPMIGFLGTFVTGSETSSAALFGKLQQFTAGQIGVNQLLTISASMFGAVCGKLISPQSIAIACAGAGMVGQESVIFRRTFLYSLVLLAFAVVVVVLEAWVFPGIWG